MVRCSLHNNFTLRADVRRSVTELTSTELSFMMSPFDLKRLDSYANNMLDYHVILDLLPTVALLYFEKRLGEEVKMSAVQSAILLALGLQRKTIEDVEVGSVY
jgi:N-acetyltransferase 10